ncbi:MAG: autotransporter-associated beta strand repeat-containing protein [Opitutae bacterium]|nr:autotransporter-associated beta strand repeat-containing protein [Opitutae bacterium]
MTGSKTTLAPGAGNTIRFQGTIDDDSTAQRLVEYSDGSYGYVSNGAGARITIGSSSNPGGTVVFEGRTGYAGGTEMMSGTLLLDGNTGSIKSGSDLIFSGQSEFRYDNTHSSGSAAKTQTFGTLAFQGSDGTVTNIKGNALSSTLGFSTITRATGATGNFVAADGTNGSTNQILIGGIAGFRSPGLFFGGNDYAVVDGGGYVRGINYGVDADSILSSGGATIGGSPDASSHVKLSGAITAQTTATLATLNLDSHNLTLGSGQTLAVNGLLQSGGAATIGGGNGITYAGFGTETDLVIRTDKASDTLTIGNALSAPNLTKSGEGILVLSGTNSIAGATALNAGTLRVNGSLTATAVTVASGATLAGSGTIGGATEFLSGGILAPGNSPGTLTFTDGVTFDAGAILDFELGTASDLIRVSGGTLTGPTSGTITLNFSDSGGFTAASYTLVDFSGATTSSFDASDFTLGSTIGGYTYQLSLAGSTLQLVATASAVPEPATYAALFGLAALGLVARRRRSARTAALSPNR